MLAEHHSSSEITGPEHHLFHEITSPEHHSSHEITGRVNVEDWNPWQRCIRDQVSAVLWMTALTVTQEMVPLAANLEVTP